MKLTLFALFEPSGPGAFMRKLEIHAAVLDELNELENLADECGVERLSAFGDNRELPEDFEGDPEEWSATLEPFEEWFGCDEGRKAVKGLLNAVCKNRRLAGRFDNWIDLEIALIDLEHELARGESERTRFRLELEG